MRRGTKLSALMIGLVGVLAAGLTVARMAQAQNAPPSAALGDRVARPFPMPLQPMPGRPVFGAPLLVQALPGGSAAPEQQPGKGPLVAFWILGGLALVGTVAMITRRKPVSAVLSLVAAFTAQAGLYVLLFAPFLATIQLLVYAGAIMVLFVFVIMLLNREEPEGWELRGIVFKAAGVAAISFVVAYFGFRLALSPRADYGFVQPAAPPASFGSAAAVGEVLFSGQAAGGQAGYLVPFEVVSLVLLVAIVGALVVARPMLAARRAGKAESATGHERPTKEAHG